jgi:sterol desaturase/sphingolipid hydroxylase (fatty acid hydroxylase superfamily)
MRAQLGRWVAVGFFPLVLCASMLAGARLVEHSREPLAVLALAAVVMLVAERLWPHLAAWQHSHGDVKVDLAHLVSVSATNAAVSAIVPGLVAPAAAALAPPGTERLWPASWPLLAQLPLALLVAELFQYWSHRLSHTWEPLWRLHATHHSAPRLYFLNAARFHPLDIAIDTAVGLVPLALLGCPAMVQAMFALFGGVFGYLQHSNVRVSLGPLNYVFSMSELHRWHHAKDLREANTNYGSNLIVWDLVFGTFFWPRDREPPQEIGIPDLAAFPQRYWAQLCSPLRWQRIRSESRSPQAAATWSAGP